MACGGLCLSKHAYLHAMLRKSTATTTTWSLWDCGKYKKLFQACGTSCLILYSRRRVTKKAPLGLHGLLSSENTTTSTMFVSGSVDQLLALDRSHINVFPWCEHVYRKNTMTLFMWSFPLAPVLRIMTRRIHNQMHDTCFSHVQQMHVLSTKNVTMHHK